jgi:hypothetical protein
MPASLVRAMVLVPALAAAAGAQSTYHITVSNIVDESSPECTIEVWAEFPSLLYCFAGAQFDLVGPTDKGNFKTRQRQLDGPGTSNGALAFGGDSVEGILPGQISQDPPLDFANPVLIWRGTWTTQDFTPRTLNLRTITRHFEVYLNGTFDARSFLPELVEGAAIIHIGGCHADCDDDGMLDLFDFLCFANEFNTGEPAADCDGNGEYDLFDFLCFMNTFNAGC